jgi:hypothetical protein
VSPGAGLDIVGKRNGLSYQELNSYHTSDNHIVVLIGLSQLKCTEAEKQKEMG